MTEQRVVHTVHAEGTVPDGTLVGTALAVPEAMMADPVQRLLAEHLAESRLASRYPDVTGVETRWTEDADG